ncbi:expressed unknown protein [Seminavis robusta]|uniref:Uncharacterized protein n=1 Tax=Seminavis robusta TaxID=568900 RepID=A0A9N8ELW1_9STRA|nr:expressed unknown protein [Seminavis robusta]|eukprot:Sro1372_g267210.1 n/a (129) ;mRNA; f:25279-25665
MATHTRSHRRGTLAGVHAFAQVESSSSPMRKSTSYHSGQLSPTKGMPKISSSGSIARRNTDWCIYDPSAVLKNTGWSSQHAVKAKKGSGDKKGRRRKELPSFLREPSKSRTIGLKPKTSSEEVGIFRR